MDGTAGRWGSRQPRDSARRWVLLGGGLLLGGLLMILLASTSSVESFLYLGLDTLKRNVSGRLAADVDGPLRRELRQGFDCIIEAATDRRIDEESVGTFARACRNALADRRVTKVEARALRDLARQLCRTR